MKQNPVFCSALHHPQVAQKSARAAVVRRIRGIARAKRILVRVEQSTGLFNLTLCARAGRALLGFAEAGNFGIARNRRATAARSVE